jgi:hypothetical protein
LSRRLLVLLLLPALALVVWALASQLPRWTAPQSNWFEPNTPAVCAAVDSLRLYSAQRSEPSESFGSDAARSSAEQIFAQHYDSPAITISEPLAVQASLPGTERGGYYVVTAQFDDAAAVMLVDAQTGEARAIITTPLSETVTCDFDTRAALVAGVRSPPVLLFAAYVLLTAAVFVGWRLLQAKGKHP